MVVVVILHPYLLGNEIAGFDFLSIYCIGILQNELEGWRRSMIRRLFN